MPLVAVFSLRDVFWVILPLPLRQALLLRPHAVVQIRHRVQQARHPMGKATHRRQVLYPTRPNPEPRRLASLPTGTQTCTSTGGSWPEASRLLRLRTASGWTRDGGLGALGRRNRRSSRSPVLMYRELLLRRQNINLLPPNCATAKSLLSSSFAAIEQTNLPQYERCATFI
jgi:hypothetical protein